MCNIQVLRPIQRLRTENSAYSLQIDFNISDILEFEGRGCGDLTAGIIIDSMALSC